MFSCNRIVLLFLLGVLASLNIAAQDDDGDFMAKAEEKRAKEIKDKDNLDLHFNQSWKYKIGDDTLWGANNFDDSAWKEIPKGASIELSKDSLLKKYFGIVWFRTNFQADTSFINKPLGFYIEQNGSACDVYIDGKFVVGLGKVGKDISTEVAQFNVNPKPHAIVFADTGKHLIAIRFSSFHAYDKNEKEKASSHGFEIAVKDLNAELKSLADTSKYFPIIFLFAVFLTLGVVHTLLFFYFRSDQTNIFFGLYCLGIAFILFFVYYIITQSDYQFFKYLSQIAAYMAPLIIVPLIALYHTIYYQRLLKVFWIMIILYAANVLATVFDFSTISGICVGVLIAISIVEIFRVNIRAITRKRDGAYILGWGILYIPLTLILLIIFAIFKSAPNAHVGLESFWLYGTALSIPFSITLYVSRNFARINKKLIHQLDEIKHLSEKTLLHEKEKKKILEEQNLQLETKVTERTSEVMKQKELIEIKNKEITDSVTYAKRIQAAILPDIKLIYEALAQSFILYLPKDIVSGDFYGFAQKNGKVIIAAADCTGHGVAGAFMSMIGTSLLNQIISEKNITEPALILDELNDGIVSALKQKDGDSNDGMDVSICAFDFATRTVNFAGANRPLWLIRNNELLIYKPDKFPIGGLQIGHEEKFSSHEIVLHENDTLYLFSDGFADQFGGEWGKKMMLKQFKDALLNIQNKTMPEQEKLMTDFFRKWKGSNEQVDDVLVIGIRV